MQIIDKNGFETLSNQSCVMNMKFCPASESHFLLHYHQIRIDIFYHIFIEEEWTMLVDKVGPQAKKLSFLANLVEIEFAWMSIRHLFFCK